MSSGSDYSQPRFRNSTKWVLFVVGIVLIGVPLLVRIVTQNEINNPNVAGVSLVGGAGYDGNVELYGADGTGADGVDGRIEGVEGAEGAEGDEGKVGAGNGSMNRSFGAYSDDGVNSQISSAGDRANSGGISPNSLNVLVDKVHSLPQSYEPGDLVSLKAEGINTEGRNLYLRKDAALAFWDMLNAMKQQNMEIVVSSAYRSYSQQASTNRSWINKLGEAQASATSAPPGHSEHQLGTTIDIALPGAGGDVSSLYSNSQGSKEWIWLDQNAHKFGFVMSYRHNQKDYTGYDFEPWHWRYVGKDLAYKIRVSPSPPQSFYKPITE